MNKNIIFFTIVLSFFFSTQAVASENQNKEYSIFLDKATIAKGYTVGAFDNNLKLSLVPGILNESTNVEVIEINENMTLPWQLDKISSVYQFEFKNKNAYDNHKPFYIQFSYTEKNNGYKQVYFFDKNYNGWRPLPTVDFPDELFVRSLIHLPFARIAVFTNNDIMTSGKASWYKYKGGNFAASPDFPKGSILRVHNTDNNKYVDVEINDYGPERDLFPDRAIDLDKVAFAKISPTTEGIINIKIEAIKIKPDENGNILGIHAEGIEGEPKITSSAAVIIDENNKIIFNKNANEVRPLASLSKLATIKTFLEIKNNLEEKVNYSIKDEEYNYEHVDNRWESSKLKLNEGDSLTVENLIYSSLIGSTNNTVETLVRVSGLSRDEFIKKINNNVALWGATSTIFYEPTGLSPENKSTAFEYALIAQKTLTDEIIRKASTALKYEFYTENDNEIHKRWNTNELLKQNKFTVLGSKTGYLDEAGYCLMMEIKLENNKKATAVILGAETRDQSFYEMNKLLQYATKKIN